MCDKYYLEDAEHDASKWIGYKNREEESSTFTLIEHEVPQ